jgi:hypothetical protein
VIGTTWVDGRSLNHSWVRQVLAQGEIGQRLPIGIPDDAAWSRHGVLGYLASHMLAQIAGRLTAGAIIGWPIILSDRRWCDGPRQIEPVLKKRQVSAIPQEVFAPRSQTPRHRLHRPKRGMSQNVKISVPVG